MEQLTEYILGILEIAEKELKLLKILTTRAIKGIGWFYVGITLCGVGLLVAAWTCFTAISVIFGPVVAGSIASVLIFLGGGVFLWISRRSLK